MIQNLNLVDETFDEHFTNTYHLAIESDLKHLSYCMLDTRVNKCLLLKNYQIGDFSEEIALEKIQDILYKDEMLSKLFKSTTFIFKGPKYTLVPNEFFNPQELKTFFTFQNNINDLDELHFYNLVKAESTIIYAVPSRLADILKRKMPRIKILHENAVLLETIFNKLLDDDMVVSFGENEFTCSVISQSKIKFFNTFQYQAPSDVIFYLTGVAGQIGLNPDNIKLSVIGAIDKDSDTGNLLKTYFKYIRYAKATSEFEYSYKFREVDAHVLANLFNSFTCVL
jgi:hypothetical protein